MGLLPTHHACRVHIMQLYLGERGAAPAGGGRFIALFWCFVALIRCFVAAIKRPKEPKKGFC